MAQLPKIGINIGWMPGSIRYWGPCVEQAKGRVFPTFGFWAFYASWGPEA